MSYEKQTWKTGDTVTAEKLNHIEEGILNAGSGSTTTSKCEQWKNIVIDVIGDSITNGYGIADSAKRYYQWVAEKLNATVNAYGINGSTIADGNDAMYKRCMDMKKSANLILVFGGVNDYASSTARIPVGEQFIMNDTTRTLNVDTSTFYGGLNQMCLNLISTFPEATTIFLTPLRMTYNGKSNLVPNAVGNYLDEYTEAIKKVCDWFSIPVIDLGATASLYPLDDTQKSLYFIDGLHPNTIGHKVIADVIYEALDKISRKATSL